MYMGELALHCVCVIATVNNMPDQCCTWIHSPLTAVLINRPQPVSYRYRGSAIIIHESIKLSLYQCLTVVSFSVLYYKTRNHKHRLIVSKPSACYTHRTNSGKEMGRSGEDSEGERAEEREKWEARGESGAKEGRGGSGLFVS